MNFIKSKFVLVCIISACSVCILCTSIVIGRYIFSFSFSSMNETLSIQGENNISFKVRYFENNIFENGAKLSGTYYLMSYTDYIEIINSFFVNFNQSMNISYHFSAVETLVIKYQKNSDGGGNPVVYEKKNTLSEVSGNISGESISFSGASENEPGGVYIINPRRYIDIYRQFVKEQQEQSRKENVIAERVLNFSAELLITFTYYIYNISDTDLPEISETLTNENEISIPLAVEIYSPSYTGTPEFELSILLREFQAPELYIILLCSLWFTANIIGICYSVRQLAAQKDKQYQEVKAIFKKYSDEIIMSAESVDLSGYKVIRVCQFKELLKLAVNLNKPILCFHSDEKTEFCSFADEYAFSFNFIHLTDFADYI